MSRRERVLDSNENSPLITAEDGEDGPIRESLSNSLDLDDSSIKTKSTLYLIFLVLSIGGLQIVWSVEMSNGSPYLLSLGMSKALVAFVWLAGPLTGVLVQPYVGIKSDRCRISWGKRKPFMIAGTIGTVGASMLLAYAKDIMWVFSGMQTDAKYEGAWKIATIVFATVMMWILDFSINTVQAAIRAFIVDGAPAHQQETANAWASRMTGVGSVFGYIFGYLDLPRYFRFFGNTQFKVLVAFASILLSSTVLISISVIKERNPQLDPPSETEHADGIIDFFRQTFASMRRLPPQTKKVCQIQIFNWVGLFPMLFYITTYIGQLYVNPDLKPGLSDDEVDKLWEKATRIGTLALLVYAIVSFAGNMFFPFFIVKSYRSENTNQSNRNSQFVTPTSPIGHRHRSASQSELSTSEYFERTESRQSITSQKTSIVQRFLNRLEIPGLTLRRAWMMALLLFSACMFSTFFITTPLAATIMVGIVGISWSLTVWAPFALISGEVASRDEARRLRHRKKLHMGELSGDPTLDEEEDQAGIILGIHNVAVSAPQVLATLLSSVIFQIAQRDRGTPGDTSVAWTLRMGGCFTLVAAYLAWTMEEASEAKVLP